METYIQDKESQDEYGQEQSIVLRTDSVIEKMRKNRGGDSTLMIGNEDSSIIDEHKSASKQNKKQPDQLESRALFQEQELMSPNGAVKNFNFDINIVPNNESPEKQDLDDNSKEDSNIGSDFPISLESKDNRFNSNLAQASNIGKTEISFIKNNQEEVSFVDSFLQEQEKLLDTQKYKGKFDAEDEEMDTKRDTLLNNGEIDQGLFKDIVEEEFDLDANDLEELDEINIEETDLESPLIAAQEAISKA
jgi:hypothetical protein